MSFVAPDGQTVIPEYYDFARSSSTVEAWPGKTFYACDEYNRQTVQASVRPDGTLSGLRTFVPQGEFSSAVDPEGNVYVADGHIYIFDPEGTSIGVIRMPERPTSLAIGGTDGHTLFIAARRSLYRYTIHH